MQDEGEEYKQSGGGTVWVELNDKKKYPNTARKVEAAKTLVTSEEEICDSGLS